MLTLPASAITDPTVAVTTLLAALSLSSASGLRAYLPLLALALGVTVDPSHPIALSAPFQQFVKHVGWPWIIGVLVVLVVAEFAVDKLPLFDHISDAVHTVIRPASGAIVMAATSNPISERNIWVAAAIGAVLALGVHSVKATTRPAVTATTAGVGNPVVSFIEDAIAVALSALALIAPFLAIALVVILAVSIGWIIWLAVHKFRQLRASVAENGRATIPLGGGRT
ncbi:MAG TPA: DUF4126 domain-containing protein [Ktedonobacterales bacterium]|jgi:hypothetical protein|nr:DUF4126 domain-containing protein [Ktedonobacterales bacterium]